MKGTISIRIIHGIHEEGDIEKGYCKRASRGQLLQYSSASKLTVPNLSSHDYNVE
jgi:hypothetical protein